MKRSREQLDFTTYVRAFAVYARNPTVIVLPLLAALAGVLVNQVNEPLGGGGLIASITIFILLLLQMFALGVSTIIADQGWRRGTASFDDAWQDARRKGGDILMASFGLTFVMSIAQFAGTIVGSFVGVILLAVAAYFLIYTIPAAAIGGIPGGAAISVSIERVRGGPLNAALLAVVTLVLLYYAPGLLEGALFNVFNVTSPLIGSVLGAVVQSILMGYIAIVMAKVYNDVSFTTPRW